MATVMDKQAHWQNVYGTKATDAVSWYRPHLETSLRLIEQATAGDHAKAIVDVGGGASTLVDDLLARGYTNITVLDISEAALDAARVRMGEKANRVRWMCDDVTRMQLPAHAFDVWHDRAVFHFLTAVEDRAAYVAQVGAALKAGGSVVIGTFGPEGPAKCSGLNVAHYDAVGLAREFGCHFRLLEDLQEIHTSPSGAAQQFQYCRFVFES